MSYVIGTTITTGVVLSDATAQNPATIAATGYVGNTGTAAGHDGDAVYGSLGTAWTVVNDGTIVSNSGTAASVGIDLKSGGSVTNNAAGSIAGQKPASRSTAHPASSPIAAGSRGPPASAST